MFKTLKHILAGILAAALLVAIGASVYSVLAAPGANPLDSISQAVSANGNGNGNGTGASVLDLPASDLNTDQNQSILNSASNNGNGNQGGNGQGGNGNGGQGNGANGNGGQGNSNANGSGIPQANITGANTVHGTVVSFDQTGLSLTLDDGSALYVQLGNSRYSQSIGFAPQVGEIVTVYGFNGDQGLFSAITVTLDGTSQVYSFRSETGQPLWAGGNGKGNGGNH